MVRRSYVKIVSSKVTTGNDITRMQKVRHLMIKVAIFVPSSQEVLPPLYQVYDLYMLFLTLSYNFYHFPYVSIIIRMCSSSRLFCYHERKRNDSGKDCEP